MVVLLALLACFLLSMATAHDKVVVIPLHSAKKLAKVVTATASGGIYKRAVWIEGSPSLVTIKNSTLKGV